MTNPPQNSGADWQPVEWCAGEYARITLSADNPNRAQDAATLKSQGWCAGLDRTDRILFAIGVERAIAKDRQFWGDPLPETGA